MPDRIANIIVLCEDQEHQNLIRRYLIRAGHSLRSFRFEPLLGKAGSGSQYVREQFPRQVAACRGILGRRASCLLIVITDADNLTVREREQALLEELAQYGQPPVDVQNEPIVILIPKWQVETWIKCLLGQRMTEDDRNSDHPRVTSDQIKTAAETLFDWARPNAQIGTTCVPSLSMALPRLLKIG